MINKVYALKDKVNGATLRASIFLGGFIGGLSNTAVVFADDEKKAEATDSGSLDFLKNGTSNKTFDSLTKTAKETGFSFYQLVMVLGLIGVVCSLATAGVSIALHKNANKKSESKSHLVDICIGAAILFGAITIVGFVKVIMGNVKA